MHARDTTSWRRRSDTLRNDPGASTLRSNEKEAQLQAWEDDGGKTVISIKPVRVLIIDNDIGSADSLELMLHASGYSETRVAYSGHAALAIAAGFQPDIVLLDLTLFDMSSYELAQSLREHAQRRHVRLIALTFDPAHAAREEARAAGFERYLVKPFAPGDLSDLLC
jgi:CheY-like chemotaxis protein